jgi:hypothetical protein
MEPNETTGAPNGGQRRAENSGGDDAGMLTVGQHFDRINDTAQEAWTRTRDTAKDLKDALDIDGRVARNPYGTIAAAVGIGYVLGGGIFSPLTARLVSFGLKMGLRLAALPFIQNEILGLAESVGAGAPEESGSKSRKAQQSKATNKGR